MVTFNPNVLRAYLAVAAVISALLIGRSQHDIAWTSDVVLVAATADLVVLACLALLYGAGSRLLGGATLAGRLNSGIHWLAIMGIVLMAGLGHALFVKTGEILNPDILAFFLQRMVELAAVATGALDREILAILLFCSGTLLLAVFRFRRRLLAALQYGVFVAPIMLVAAGPLVFPDSSSAGEISVPPRVEEAALYRGDYKDFFGRQLAWNTSGERNWQKGILTGMSLGAAMGKLQYRALADGVAADSIYTRPRVTGFPERRPNILFLILESVRHDAVGIYAGAGNGRRSDTPTLDRIAREGWLVEKAYTTIPHTSKALVGIYCGTFARFDTDISEAIAGNLPLTCLSHLLASAGYASGHFQTAPGSFEDRLTFLANVGFEHAFTQESIAGGAWAKLGYLGVDDRAMVAPAVDWMRRQSQQGRPFFASLLTIATHHPYVSPGNIQPVHDARQAREAYVKAVRDTDAVVAEVFAALRKHGLLDNTLVVVTGDHGEAFAEHGQIAHNGVGYEEGIRVPLILQGPMLGAPRVVGGLRQHLDIMPTVLDVAGIRVSGRLPGKSLLDDPAGHAEVIAACFYSDYCLNHVSADGGKVLFFHGKRSLEMYDLNTDPGERSNLYAQATHANALQRLSAAVRLKKSYELVYQSVANPDAVSRRIP